MGIVAAVTLSLAAPVAAPVAAIAAPPEITAAPDEATAVAAARRSGKPVQITGKTTETEEFTALPSGAVKWTQHMRPVRVKRGDRWTAVDTTLVRDADGTVRPKATLADLALSGGGDKGPLVKIGQQGNEVGLAWPAALPEPELDGPVATYPDVYPGVDLKVTVEVDGFSQVLVVKTREAALNPALRRISFGSHTKGTKVRSKTAAAQDGLEVADAKGQVLFTGDASRMWDSSGNVADALLNTGPAAGGRTAVMGTEVTDQTIAVTPDAAFLTAPETKFPVYIDPKYQCSDFAWCGKQHHAVVQSGYGTAKNYDRTDGALSDLKAGWQDTDSSGTSRTYIQMHTGPIKGKTVFSAELNVPLLYSYWGPDRATSTHLYLGNWIDGNTTWNTQPGWGDWVGSSNATNQSKAPNVTAVFGATLAAQRAAAGWWDTTTLLLKGEHEGNTTSWRRFGLNPYLQVVYNTAPLKPENLRMTQGTREVPCGTIMNTASPKLRAPLYDVDPGSWADGYFELKRDGVVQSQQLYAPGQPQGNIFEATVPESWTNNSAYWEWRVKATDGPAEGGGLSSPWSEWCGFEIDTVKPNTPTIASEDGVYPSDAPGGSIGKTGRFTLRPGAPNGRGNVQDVVKYVYTFDGNAPTTEGSPSVDVGADNTASIPFTPTAASTYTLQVKAVDRAGNMSPDDQVARYRIIVLPPKGPIATWKHDGADTGSALTYAGTGTARYGTTEPNGDAWEGRSLLLDPATKDHATSATELIRTDHGYAVAAWVKLTRADGYFTIAAQDGDIASAFYLQYSADVGKWTMSAIDRDDISNPQLWRVTSADNAAVPRLNAWTHVAGVYDSAAQKLLLYVDGKKLGEAAYPKAWRATGKFTVGRAKYDRNEVDHFPGAIDEVRVWDRVVGEQEIRDIATGRNTGGQQAGVERASYRLNDGANLSTKDEIVAGRTAALSNQLIWNEDEFLMRFRGTAAAGDRITAPRPANLSTDRSFTVSAYVRPSALGSSPRTVLSVDDGQQSPFMLQYRPTSDGGRWTMTFSSCTGCIGWVGTSTKAIPKVGTEWTHLAATFNAATGTITFYVNGEQVGTATGHTGWNNGGALLIGAAKFNRSYTDFFAGDIDDVRVFTGALDSDNVRQLGIRH